MIAKTEYIFLPISSCFGHFCDRHLESAIFIYESSWQIRNQRSENLFEYILTIFLVNFNLDDSFFCKMGKFNICITLPKRKSTIVAKPTIETSQIENFQYSVPFLYIFWKESRTSNARTLKVFFSTQLSTGSHGCLTEPTKSWEAFTLCVCFREWIDQSQGKISQWFIKK